MTMHSNEFFTNLLRLRPPFTVADVVIQQAGKKTERIDVYLAVNADFTPKKSGAVCLSLSGYDERTWQHLSVFNFPCYLHCSVPRFKFKMLTTGKVAYKAVSVPWSKANSGVTKDLEDWTMQLIEIHGNVASVSRQLSIRQDR